MLGAVERRSVEIMTAKVVAEESARREATHLERGRVQTAYLEAERIVAVE